MNATSNFTNTENTKGAAEALGERGKIRVMLLDDHPIVRRGLKDILDSSDDILVCGEATNAREALELMEREKPDVVIADIMLDDDIDGIEFVKLAAERFPGVYVLILSMHDESIYAERAIKAGARGYIMKDAPPRTISDAIRAVMKGDIYLKEELSKSILGRMIQRSTGAKGWGPHQMSDREFEIYQLIGNGFSIREIADKLKISVYTVESHRKSIKMKLNLKDSSDLTRNAIQWVITQNKSTHGA